MGVIVAGVIMLTTGWYYADLLISAGIGLFIRPRTWLRMDADLRCECAERVRRGPRFIDAEVLSAIHDVITQEFPIAPVTIQVEKVGWRECEAHL